MQVRLLDERWTVHFIDGNVSRSIESLLANEDSGRIRLLCKKVPKNVTPSDVRASLKRAKIRIDFPVPGYCRWNAATRRAPWPCMILFAAVTRRPGFFHWDNLCGGMDGHT
jgi:hypothetical protein